MSWSDSRRPSGFPTWLFGSTYLFSFVASQEILGSPKFLSFLSTHATLFVTPADPLNAHHFAFFVLASDSRISSPSALLDCLSVHVVIEAISRFRKCGLPCGLCRTLYTLQWYRSVADACALCPCFQARWICWHLLFQRQGFLSPTVTPLTGLSFLLYHCSTRYKWLVRPCLPGTFTLEETLSFAWRTPNSTSDIFCQQFHSGTVMIVTELT